MKVLFLGRCNDRSRRFIDDVLRNLGVTTVLMLDRSGHGRYAYDRALELGLDRAHFAPDHINETSAAYSTAIARMVACSKPDLVFALRAYPHDYEVMELFRQMGVRVVSARYTQGLRVYYEPQPVDAAASAP